MSVIEILPAYGIWLQQSRPSRPRQRWVPIRGTRLPRTPTKAETVTGRSWEGFEAQREAAQTAEKRLLKAVPMKAREGGRKRPPSHEQNVGRRRGGEGRSDEFSDGNGERVFGQWGKGNPCDKAAQDSAKWSWCSGALRKAWFPLTAERD